MSKSQYKCPHCGSDKDACFSRVDPMGFYCPDCGKDVGACPECIEQSRLLGMSAEREADLLGELERERALADRLGEGARIMWPFIEEELSCGFLTPGYMNAIESHRSALSAWKEARRE